VGVASAEAAGRDCLPAQVAGTDIPVVSADQVAVVDTLLAV